MTQDSGIVASAEIGAGAYIGYKGIEHGLPRALGLRMEYHTTNKTNAKLIINNSNSHLDPKFGGKNGFSKVVNDDVFLTRSKNYIHITGFHPKSDILTTLIQPITDKYPKLNNNLLINMIRPFHRRMQTFLYKTEMNNPEEMPYLNKRTLNKINTIIDKSLSKQLKFSDLKPNNLSVKTIIKGLYNNSFHNKTERFVIPGTDSYFEKKLIPDPSDIALKSSRKIKAYTNRFHAMIAGLKKFGLSGAKENKYRVAAGIVGILATGNLAFYMVQDGIHKLKDKKIVKQK